MTAWLQAPLRTLQKALPLGENSWRKQALLEILEGEDSQSQGGDQRSHTSSQLSSLRSSSLRDMLAAFVTMTTRDIQERVQHLEAALHDR